MIDSLPTSLMHCGCHTGSVDLLSKSGNAPTSTAPLQQKPIHGDDVSGRTRNLDAQNHRTRQTGSSEHHSNPHSSVETKQKHLLRPRGFLH
jgi:hypothetical protein